MNKVSSQLMLVFGKEQQWKHFLANVSLVMLTVSLVTAVIYVLQLHPYISTTLLVYLFIILWLTHTRGFKMAVLAAFTAFIAFNFFLVRPIFSFNIYHVEEGLALFIFLLF